MPELRKDPLVGRWVIIATERARRPGTFVDPQANIFDPQIKCPFCDDNHKKIIFSIKNEKMRASQRDWLIRVVPNLNSILKIEESFNRRGNGLYDVFSGYGAHEVVIETSEHIANMADLDLEQIRLVIETYKARFKDLEKDPNLQCVLAYKNYGWAAGARRIGHSRSQIMASPVNPLLVQEKLIGAKRYFDYHERCIYCDVIEQERKLGTRIVVETEHFIALAPFAARFPFELWMLPKKHHCDFADGIVGLEADLAKILKDILLRFKIGLDDPAYNYVLQTAPFRREEDRGRFKTIREDYHWHMELMPRLTRVAGFEKGTGFYICPIPPEQAAEFLRTVGVKESQMIAD